MHNRTKQKKETEKKVFYFSHADGAFSVYLIFIVRSLEECIIFDRIHFNFSFRKRLHFTILITFPLPFCCQRRKSSFLCPFLFVNLFACSVFTVRIRKQKPKKKELLSCYRKKRFVVVCTSSYRLYT